MRLHQGCDDKQQGEQRLYRQYGLGISLLFEIKQGNQQGYCEL